MATAQSHGHTSLHSMLGNGNQYRLLYPAKISITIQKRTIEPKGEVAISATLTSDQYPMLQGTVLH